MHAFIQNLTATLEQSLKNIQFEPDPDERHARSKQIIGNAVLQLQEHIMNIGFASVEEEITYYKELFPAFHARLLIFFKLEQLELEKAYHDPQVYETFLNQELLLIHHFNQQHNEFLLYYHFHKTDRDKEYFTRGAWDYASIEELIFMAAPYSCAGSYWLARHLANKRVGDYLHEELATLQKSKPISILAQPAISNISPPPSRDVPELKWARSTTDLVEQIYAWYAVRAFGNATIKQIADWVAYHLLHEELEHYYNTFQEIRRRKTVRTKFIPEMNGQLLNKMDSMDA